MEPDELVSPITFLTETQFENVEHALTSFVTFPNGGWRRVKSIYLASTMSGSFPLLKRKQKEATEPLFD